MCSNLLFPIGIDHIRKTKLLFLGAAHLRLNKKLHFSDSSFAQTLPDINIIIKYIFFFSNDNKLYNFI